MSVKKRLARGFRAGGYLLASFFTGLAQLGGLVFPALLRPMVSWQLRRSADWVNAGERARRPRRDGHRRWLAVHSALDAVFGVGFVGAVVLIPTVVGALVFAVAAFLTSISVPSGLTWFSVVSVSVILTLSLIIGFVLGMVGGAIPRLATGHANLTISLLSGSAAERRAAELSERVSILTSTRADALDAHSAELRRIERDLHDGAQAQLVALSMRLGVAEETIAEDPIKATRLLREARGGAEEAMAELRDVVRTMYPPILADRGLAGAISGLAARSIIPVRVHVEGLGEVPAPVEAAAYFVVAESVTNAIKHSHATQLLVHLDRDSDGLHVQVTDDGVGGVDAAQGTGILGIERRVAALDGMTTVDSPIGGGTTITVELPCRP